MSSQPQPVEQFNIVLTAPEREVALAFINSGYRSEISRVGLSSDAVNITNNAAHILQKFLAASKVEVPPVAE